MSEGALSFCWHLHQPFFVDDEEIIDKLNESYLILVEIHEQLEVPMGLSISGNLLSKLERLAPEFVDKLKEMEKEGLVEILGTTYYHAAKPIIPPEHLKQHIEMDLKIKEKIFQKPEIYFPADFAWVPWTADILLDFGFRATILDTIGVIKSSSVQVWKWTKIGKAYKVNYVEEKVDEPVYQVYMILSISGRPLLAILRDNMISMDLTKKRDGALYKKDIKALNKICKNITQRVKKGYVFSIGGDGEWINLLSANNYEELLYRLKEENISMKTPKELINKKNIIKFNYYICSHSIAYDYDVWLKNMDNVSYVELLRRTIDLLNLAKIKLGSTIQELERELLKVEDSGCLFWKVRKHLCFQKLLEIYEQLRNLLAL